jgi:hypothetical protein
MIIEYIELKDRFYYKMIIIFAIRLYSILRYSIYKTYQEHINAFSKKYQETTLDIKFVHNL